MMDCSAVSMWCWELLIISCLVYICFSLESLETWEVKCGSSSWVVLSVRVSGRHKLNHLGVPVCIHSFLTCCPALSRLPTLVISGHSLLTLIQNKDHRPSPNAGPFLWKTFPYPASPANVEGLISAKLWYSWFYSQIWVLMQYPELSWGEVLFP